MSIHFQKSTQSHIPEGRTLHTQPQVRTSISTYYIQPGDGMTIRGFWTDEWIYWILTLVTTNNYDSLTELPTPNITVNYSTQKIFNRRCLVEASNGGRSPFLWDPEPSRTVPGLSYQLPTSHNCNSQLTQQLKSKTKFYEHYNRRSVGVRGPRLNCCYCQTVVGLLMWGALSDQRTGLTFTIAAGPRQGSHTRVQVLRDSLPYFTGVRLDTPPTWRARSLYLYPPETGWPSYTTRNWREFPFRRLLQLAGLRWRYSNPPQLQLKVKIKVMLRPLNKQLKFKVKVILRLTDYRHLIRCGAKPLETHDHRCFQLNSCGHSPYVSSSLTRNGFIAYEYTWPFAKCTYRTYTVFFFLTLLSGSTALRFRATRRSLATKRIRILPMNLHAWWPITFGMKGGN
jgi:hypothetical protein